MLDQFAFVGVFLIVALVFGVLPPLLASFVRPKKGNHRKTETYECGMHTYGETWVQFKDQYYIYAMTFALFAVQIVFLLPWALVYNALAIYAVVEALLFITILLSGLLYLWRKGALRWIK